MKIAFRCFRSDKKSVLHTVMQHALRLLREPLALLVGKELIAMDKIKAP